jgi:Ca2+-transporting ATPase
LNAAASAPLRLEGLSEAEAAVRLEQEGPNSLPGKNQRGVLAVAIEVVREPMFALLLVGGAVYLALGDLAEALVLMAFASLSVAIAIVQEFRSEHVLTALRDLSSPVSVVIRAGRRTPIPSERIVRGDLVALSEGERVPADVALLQGHEVEADESLLTGESAPVAKRIARPGDEIGRPGGDDTPYLYSGSLVVRGQGVAEVLATGSRSELGKLGLSVESVVSQPGHLTIEIRRIVRAVGAAAFVVCAVVVLLVGLVRGSWLQAALSGVALGMAMLPEEFPLVLTVFMVMGAWRLSRVQVLTKRAAAIETLGSASVLCTDKTGTLTLNRVRLVAVWANGALAEWPADKGPPEAALPLVRASLLASAQHPFDPMEQALQDACDGPFAPEQGLRLERAYGLTPDLMAVTQVWRESEDEVLVASKGAPEAIARLCRLQGDAVSDLMAAVERLAGRGVRVLAVAQERFAESWTPDNGAALALLGLVGFADPLRPQVARSVAECRAAGVRVVMVTGDYPATAGAIASQAGLAKGDIMTGGELDRLSDAELAARARGVSVFARILPEQKLRIVRALQSGGEVVAMTGDGVNDAPALKAADIGIAMGARGTDVARAAADLVLLDDAFESIVRGMRLGRRIYDNLWKATGFILAVHIPIAGLALLPLLLGLPVFLVPAHIAFIEMIIDPMCSIVFEAEREEPGVMARPPRPASARLFTGWRVAGCAIQGAVALVAVAGAYAIDRASGQPLDEVRATAFLSLVLAVLALTVANRSLGSALAALARPNLAFLAVVAMVAGAMAAIMTVPAVRALFHFAPVGPGDLGIALGAGATSLVGLDLVKRVLPDHRLFRRVA